MARDDGMEEEENWWQHEGYRYECRWSSRKVRDEETISA